MPETSSVHIISNWRLHWWATNEARQHKCGAYWAICLFFHVECIVLWPILWLHQKPPLIREKETFCFAYDVLGSSNCHNGGFAQQHAQTCHLCVPLYFFLGDRLFRICFLITKCQYFIPCLTDILFSGKSSLYSLFSTTPLLRMRPKYGKTYEGDCPFWRVSV